MKAYLSNLLGLTDNDQGTVSYLTPKKTIVSYNELRTLYPLDSTCQRINDIVGLHSTHFEYLYHAPIKILANRLQHIPSKLSSYDTLLEQKLDLISRGMKFRESTYMPERVDPDDINIKRDAWRYATFFALLMHDLGPSITSFKVLLPSPGQKAIEWNPFGKLPNNGSIVNYKPATPLTSPSTTLFAPLLFSPASLDWLRLQEQDAFEQALSVIQNTTTDTLLGRVVCHVVAKQFPNVECETSAPSCNDLSTNKIAETNQKNSDLCEKPTARTEGELFFKWLVDGYRLKDQDVLSLSTPCRGAIAFKAPDIFANFASSRDADWKVVKNGFNKLKKHFTNQNGNIKTDLFEIPAANGKLEHCLVLDQHYFDTETSSDIEPERDKAIPNFLTWFRTSLTDNQLTNTRDNPLYIPVDGDLYIIVPTIFELYADITFLTIETIAENFLQLGLHIKNGSSDFFSIPLSGRSLEAIKIPSAIVRNDSGID